MHTEFFLKSFLACFARNAYIVEGSEVSSTKNFCFCLVTVVDQIVLGPVSWPGKLHFATVFDLQNGKFSQMTHPRTPSRFVPVGSLNAHELSSNIVYAFKRGKSIFENFKQAYFEEE